MTTWLDDITSLTKLVKEMNFSEVSIEKDDLKLRIVNPVRIDLGTQEVLNSAKAVSDEDILLDPYKGL